MRGLAGLLLVALGSAGCLATSTGPGISGDQTACATCKHNSNVGGGAGGGSSAGSSSGSSGASGSSGSIASTSGSSGGSSGGGASSGGSSGGSGPDAGQVICPSAWVPSPPVSCQAGSQGLSSQLVDFIQCTVVPGGTVQALSPEGLPYTEASALSATDGTFGICLPDQAPFSLEASAPQYPTTYFAELQSGDSQFLAQVGLLSTDFLSAINSFLPGGFDGTRGFLIAKVNTTHLCDRMRPGWTVSMSLPDGGNFPDGGYEMSYLSVAGVPTSGLTATTNSGYAIFYNIDASLTNFVTLSYANPDAGADCQPLDPSYGFTERIYVAGNTVSVFPILLP